MPDDDALDNLTLRKLEHPEEFTAGEKDKPAEPDKGDDPDKAKQHRRFTL